MAVTDARQFGERRPGLAYADRPCVFGVLARGDQIALVHITKPETFYHDLPGGALDPGEDEAAAVVREFGEETGLVVAPGEVFTRADQYMIKDDGRPVNNRCAFFALTLSGEDSALKIEDDHALVWLDPLEALTRLRHDAHAWAVLAWLRGGRP